MATKERVKFGVAIPYIFPDGPPDMALVRQVIQKVDVLGYHSAWVGDGIPGYSRSLDPITLLGYAAAISSNIRLGISILATPLRNPLQVAKMMGCVDQLSGGRLDLGIGFGLDHAYIPAYGVPLRERVPRLVEGLNIMKALWTQSPVNFQGQFWQLEGVNMEPKPIQKPHPPIWFGGQHPDALRRAVRHGDGWMGAGSSSTAQFMEAVAVLRRSLEEQGRDPSTFAIAKRVYIAVEDDEREAEKRLREYTDHVYHSSDRAVEVSVWGSPGKCIQELAEITGMGAQLLMLDAVYDQLEQVDRLAQDVMPYL